MNKINKYLCICRKVAIHKTFTRQVIPGNFWQFMSICRLPKHQYIISLSFSLINCIYVILCFNFGYIFVDFEYVEHNILSFTVHCFNENYHTHIVTCLVLLPLPPMAHRQNQLYSIPSILARALTFP